MNSAILLELVKKWEEQADPKKDAPATDQSGANKDAGRREAKRECADTLRLLVGILG